MRRPAAGLLKSSPSPQDPSSLDVSSALACAPLRRHDGASTGTGPPITSPSTPFQLRASTRPKFGVPCFRFRVVASLGPEQKPGSSKSPSSTLFVAPDVVGRASALAIALARACSSTALRLAAGIPEEPRRASWGPSPPDVALPRPRGDFA